MTKEENALQGAVQYIESWLPLLTEQGEVPGIAVAVRHKNRLILDSGYGYANLENKEKLTGKHIFHIASHSKMFTATAIMQLKEKSQLQLDNEVVNILPWLNKHTDKRWLNVTIRQLLGHRAGVIRDGKDANHWNLVNQFPDNKMLDKIILDSELVFDTNQIMKYSNIGYGLLGLVIEQVSGISYEKYMQKNIIKPLKMTHTSSDYDENLGTYTTGYRSREDDLRIPYQLGVHANALSAATGFCSTASDTSLFASAQMLKTKKLMNDESKKELQRLHSLAENAYNDHYGLGFQPHPKKKGWVGHNGGFPGFSTSTLANGEKDIAISVFTNYDSGNSTTICLGIIDIIEWFLENSSKSDTKNSKYAGRFYSLRSVFDIVATNKKIIETYPKANRPFNEPTALEVINDNTLKIDEEDHNFYSPGEKITFKRVGGKITEVNYAGFTHFQEKDYKKILAQITKDGRVKLP